ncbi:MAG: HgcAB-associated protein [Syntrophales bacterium]|nr:HgcAB-associated protein [Syntrophales bacterium]
MNQNCREGTCKIDALVSIDDRGQMVLPKEVREQLGIKAGDKMALVTWEKEGRACCLTLIPVKELAEGIKSFLNSIIVTEQIKTKKETD